MTKDKLKSEVLQTIGNNIYFNEQIDALLRSGAVDVDSINENDYGTIRAMAYAVIQSNADMLKPNNTKFLAEAKNYLNFI